MAAEIDAQIQTLPVQNTPSIRTVRRRYSQRLKTASREYVLDLAKELLTHFGYRWVAYELIHHHEETFRGLAEADLEEFGRGMDSWWSVDAFARILSGPAWLNGQVSDEVIHLMGSVRGPLVAACGPGQHRSPQHEIARRIWRCPAHPGRV